MEDIFGIKGNIDSLVGDIVIYPLFIFVFLYFFYFILNKYFWKVAYADFKNDNTLIKQKKNSKKVILSKLKNLESKANILEKSKFYLEVNKLFREYLGYINKKNFLEKTLEEIKLELLLDKKNHKKTKKLLLLFGKSYKLEFLEGEDNLEKRKNILKEFINILK